MERGNRRWIYAAMAAVSLLLCAALPEIGDAGPPRRDRPALKSAGGKYLRLSIKISEAKKRKRQVSFYKSVARQEKIRSSGARSLSSGR